MTCRMNKRESVTEGKDGAKKTKPVMEEKRAETE